jgi:hypothetical protein
MPDMFDILFAGYVQSEIGSASALQANTDQRLTSTADRLAELEHRYERMHIVTVGLWALLKEHTGLTDSDLKRFVREVETAESKARATSGVMPCERCSRIL